MKAVVVSDSHGLSLNIIKEKEKDADLYLHCGDIVLPYSQTLDFICVRGNHDDEKYPLNKIIEFNNHKILMLHGHTIMSNEYNKGLLIRIKTYEDMIYFIERIEEQLADYAKEIGCDIVLYGHIHLYRNRLIDGIQILNPGSMLFNNDGSKQGYIVLEDKDNLKITFKTL